MSLLIRSGILYLLFSLVLSVQGTLFAMPLLEDSGSSKAETVTEQELAESHSELRYTYIALVLLGGMFVFGTANCFRTRKLNRRLKESEALIKARNEELQRASEELLHAKERAEMANHMKSRFIQNMSHEVRTPLNSIMGFTQVMTSQLRHDPSMAEYARIVESSSMNLMRVIDDVLDISYLDQTQILPTNDCCELNSRCRECADAMLRYVKPGVAVVFEQSADNPVVQINARRVLQVINHLLHNAAKFTHQGEIILNYNCLSAQGLLRFTVSDTGPGIPADKHEQVFDRFVKLDNFTQGTGLGLSICRVIAEKLSGTLVIDPTYHGGCRMIFEIPLVCAVDAAAQVS